MSDEEATKCCVHGCFRVLPISHFGRSPKSADGLNSRCKPCESDRAMVRKHGLTAAQKAVIAEAQGGCLTCRNPNPGMKGWVVDHDRSCCPGEASCANCRRGILCQFCNSALGYARDNPATLRALADYLESESRLRVAPAITGCESIRTDGLYGQDVEPTHRNHQRNGSNAHTRISKSDELADGR